LSIRLPEISLKNTSLVDGFGLVGCFEHRFGDSTNFVQPGAPFCLPGAAKCQPGPQLCLPVIRWSLYSPRSPGAYANEHKDSDIKLILYNKTLVSR